MDWFKSYPADYRDDTWHLSLAEHGAYKLLIDHYMHHEKPLPDNDRALASIIGVSVEDWILVSSNVREFFTQKRGKLTHKRCEEELNVSFDKRKDGKKRVAKYRKSLSSVTHDKRVSNAPRGEERRGQDNSSSSPEKVKKEIIPDFLRAYNASKKTKAFNGRPFPELVEACSDPTWVDEAKKALQRLPACAYFKTAVTIHQIVKTGFVEKINAGAFDTVTTRHNFRGGEAPPNPPRVFDDDARERKELTLRKLELEQQVREAAP